MNREFEVNNSLHLKALSHPLRLGILNCLDAGEMTNEQLAAMLGVESGKLYFHTKKLLDAGMIEVAETRAKGPITEKYYRAVATRFTAQTRAARNAPSMESVFSAAVDLYRQSDRGATRDHEDATLVFHLVLPQSLQARLELKKRLQALALEFQDHNPGTDDTKLVSFSVLVHTVPARAGQGETAIANPSAD